MPHGGGFRTTEETPQRFNLKRDPSESYDLSAHNPEITQQLLARMTELDTALRADAAARRAAS